MKLITLSLLSRQQGAVINMHRIYAGTHKIHSIYNKF